MDEELKEYLDHKFEESDAKFREALHETETRLLSEFWKWGRTNDIRMRRLEGEDATTAERLSAMEHLHA